MDNKYKIIISNQTLYKEVELPVDARNYCVGTTIDCDFRLHKELFQEDIKLDLLNNSGNWSVVCADNIYISTGDTRRVITTQLQHGDCFSVKYQETNSEAFAVEFTVDFDSKTRKFERRIDIGNISKVSIGADGENDIIVHSRYIKRDKIELVKSKEGLMLNIINATYGVYHNGNKAEHKEIIKNRDFFALSDFMFYYKDGGLWTEAESNINVKNLVYADYPVKNNYPKFVRNTRIKYVCSDEKIELLVPPALPKKPQQNLALTLLPSLAMLALTVVVRGIMSTSSNNNFLIFSVCSMTLGIITSVATYFNTKKKYTVECKERIRQYKEYIERKKEEIAEVRKREKELLDIIYKDTEKDISIVNDVSSELFDRLKCDDDFLEIYIGKGLVKSKRIINYKKAESFQTDDALADLPEQLTKQYEMIGNSPITINLCKSGTVGVLGTRENNYEFMKIMLTDLICRHYYGDVKIFLLIDEKEKYLWAKKLPHLRNENKTRNIVYDIKSKNNIFEELYKELTIRSTMKSCKELTYLVILVQNEWGIKTHPLSQFIEEADRINVAFVFFENYRSEIPLYCKEIVELFDSNKGKIVNATNGENVSEFVYRTITDREMYNICGVLEPIFIEEISLESSMKKSISLFDLMNIYTLEDVDLMKNWTSAQVWTTMAAPIGVNAKNEVVCLDLHEKYHGPHGLVAGTTGSGKSEILQTYILSAAMLFHPYEVSFVIIDFKGGGMVNQFKNLPHLIGAITNIDGREINRSLKSIKAELLKRQTLFAEANVNHIDKYIKLYKSGNVKIPLPHLVIIVDEFAELKAEQPEFMKELISAARIGRSLGVHLILATQKPSGQVNEQIWSNSKFKLCLKVQTKEDSNEVIKSPLAAEIKEPGRAYLQVGNNEIFELLQSGYSAALEKEGDENEKEYVIFQVDFGGYRKEIYRKSKKSKLNDSRTQLEAIVQYINSFCAFQHIEKLSSICLPPLQEKISMICSSDNDHNKGISIGIYDDPSSQYQGEAKLNILGENYVIIGSSGSGKTNLLQVIVRQIVNLYSPKQANIYIIDFGAMYLKNYDALNHVGGVVTISEEEKLKNLFKLLVGEIQSRKDRFMKIGISSFASYIESGYEEIPQIFVMVDNFTAFKEIYGDIYEEDFMYITREGLSCGINVIITNAQTAGFGYKYMSNFAGRIAFYCNDSSEYSTLFERCRMQPKEIPGRGLCKVDKELYELQTYLAFEGEKEIQRSDAIKEFIKMTKERYGNLQAKRIPEVPETLTLGYIENNYGFIKNKYIYPVGLDYATVDISILNFEKINELCIVGNDIFLRLNCLQSVIETIEAYILEESVHLYIVDNIQRKLKYLGEKAYTEEYTIDYSQIGEIIINLEEKLTERYEKLAVQETGTFKKMPLYFVVVNSKEAIEYISANKNILEKYNKIVKQYKSLGVCFVYSDLEDAVVPYGAPELMKRLKENKKALITTQKLKEFKFCEIPSAILRNMKTLKQGDIYLLDGSEVNRIKMIGVKENV